MRWLERLLLWYDPENERLRNQRTARIARESEAARARAARVIAAYRRADDAHTQASRKARAAGEDLIEESKREDGWWTRD
jgi:hypothetical protein